MKTKPTEMDKAYMAGFFDGEGSISIETIRRANPTRPNFRVRISISQVEPAPLIWIQERWGGYLSPRKMGKHSRKNYYQLVFFAQDCLSLLHDITPLLQVKREHAEIATAFFALVRPRWAKGETTANTGRGRSLTDQEWIKRKELTTALRAINRWAGSARQEQWSGSRYMKSEVIQ